MAKTMGSGEKCAGVMVATEARKHRGIPTKKFCDSVPLWQIPFFAKKKCAGVIVATEGYPQQISVILCLCGKYPFSEGKINSRLTSNSDLKL